MKILNKLLLSISLLTLSGLSHSACNVINGSGELTLDENNFVNDKACIVISDLTIANTVIVGDVQLPGMTTQSYVSYGIDVQAPQHNLQQFRVTDQTEFAKLVVDNTAQIQLDIVKKPENAHLKHSFSIVVNKETFGITVIHIKPNAIDESFIAPPPSSTRSGVY